MKKRTLMLGLAAVGAFVVITLIYRKLVAPAQSEKSSPYVQNTYTSKPVVVHGVVTPVGDPVITKKSDMYDVDFVNSLRDL